MSISSLAISTQNTQLHKQYNDISLELVGQQLPPLEIKGKYREW